MLLSHIIAVASHRQTDRSPSPPPQPPEGRPRRGRLALRNRVDPRQLLVPGVLGLLALVCGAVASERLPDDMFISFRYAWNLVHGEGFVFNPGERVFGLTNPGHALGLALLHGITRVPVHALATVVFGGALWALAVVLYREGRGRRAAAEAIVGGTLVLTSSYVWIANGSASTSVLTLLAGSAVLVHRRPATSGGLAALAVWYRPDAIAGAAALGALAWMERRRPPWRWAVAAGVVLAVGLVAAWLWFGSVLPNTLEAKRAMAEALAAGLGTGDFWLQGAPVLRRHLGPGWLAWIALGLAGQWPLFRRGGRAIRTLILYGAGVAVAYPLLGVPFFQWYTVPPAVCLLYGVAAFGVGVGRAVARSARDAGDRPGLSPRQARWAGAALASLVLAGPALGLTRASRDRFQHFGDPSRFAQFREAALWIREHSLPEHRIAYGEIGNLAYWSRRPVDDLMGLVTPEVLPYVAARDRIGGFLLRPPDFFLDHPASPHPGIASRPWFRQGYYPVAGFEDAAGRDRPAVVYRKRPDAALPPPRPPAGRGRRPAASAPPR
ncbi:MAG: hypothetical protein ACLF0P_09445 [Thermoanaerobaculia bacterium]